MIRDRSRDLGQIATVVVRSSHINLRVARNVQGVVAGKLEALATGCHGCRSGETDKTRLVIMVLESNRSINCAQGDPSIVQITRSRGPGRYRGAATFALVRSRNKTGLSFYLCRRQLIVHPNLLGNFYCRCRDLRTWMITVGPLHDGMLRLEGNCLFSPELKFAMFMLFSFC